MSTKLTPVIPTRKISFNLPVAFAKLMDAKIKKQVTTATIYLIQLVRADVTKPDAGVTAHGQNLTPTT